jgi:hypothetical protein
MYLNKIKHFIYVYIVFFITNKFFNMVLNFQQISIKFTAKKDRDITY